MSKGMRIAVTGLGAVSPYGIGAPALWEGLVNNESAIDRVDDPELNPWLPVAAELKEYNPEQYLPRKLIRDTDKATQFALISAAEALADAGLGQFQNEDFAFVDGVDSERVGIAIGTAYGGIQSLAEGITRLAEGANRVGPRLVPKSIPNAPAYAMAMRHGIQGPVMTYSTACASSANAIGEAIHWLLQGEVDVLLAGGTEHLFIKAIAAGLRAAGALAVEGPEDFSTWSRPFDKHRTGMVMGEGAGILVLEPYDRAKARGAHIYAEFAGYGASNDAYHETSPHPGGRGAAIAVRKALQKAGLSPDEVDYVNAHATSTPAGDEAECKALASVFGNALDDVLVSSIKGAVGHMLGAAAVIESIACIKAIETGVVPGTLHCVEKDDAAPRGLIQGNAIHHPIQNALSTSFGFGGQNGVLVWKRSE